MIAKLALEGGLQRVAVDVVRGEKIPFVAELIDQRIGNRVRFQRVSSCVHNSSLYVSTRSLGLGAGGMPAGLSLSRSKALRGA
jgi:hypothetical protein